ncbi:hypothetical protein C8Q79DRAFT_45865 [Trametes meyenii]|nr:hypothetical protein C8Q79DRAFT_45865 [Trametes meyenii]
MQLTFSPALGEQTVLKAAPAASGRSTSQSILFKVSFESRGSLLEAQRDGIKVEVWSDVPAGGRLPGEWGAVQFGTMEPGPALRPQVAERSALHDAAEEDGLAEDRSLYAGLRVSLSDRVGARFSFTYRLVYPSGHVQWLGEFGRNGELVVEQGLPGVDLREGWNISGDGTYRTHAFPGDRVLGSLTDPQAWSCWLWKESSIPVFASTVSGSEALAMVLLPRPNLREVNVLRPLVFVASDSATLNVTEEGKIILRSSSPFARVSFGVLEHSRELLKGIAALCNGEVLALDDVSAVLSCRPADADLPIHLIVLPAADNVGKRPAIPVRPGSLPKEAAGWDGLALLPQGPGAPQFISGPVVEKEQVVALGPSGGEIVITPMYNINVDACEWQAALLSPHKDPSVKLVWPAAETLPTPPPSPPLSRASPPRAIVPASRDETSASSPTAIASTIPSQPPSVSRRRERISPPRRAPPSSALIPYNSPRTLRRYLHMVLNVVLWFWSVFVKALAARVVGESLTRRISGLIGLALLKTAPPPSPRTGYDRQVETREESLEKPMGTLDTSDATGVPGLPVEVTDEGSGVSVPSPQYAVPLGQEHRNVKSPPHVTLVATVPTRLSESPALILKGCNLSPKEVRATIGGQPLPPPTLTNLDDDLRLMFEGVEGGGALEVTINL